MMQVKGLFEIKCQAIQQMQREAEFNGAGNTEEMNYNSLVLQL